MSMKTRKHEEVTSALRELAETLKPGERFPTHREVMRQFQVSDRTALRSLEELQRTGWIVRRSGVGTFVADLSGQGNILTGLGVETARYSPSATRNGTLLVFALSDSPFFQNAVEVIAAQAAAADLSMVCHYVRREAPDADLSDLTTRPPAGVLIFGYLLEPLAARVQTMGVPTVLIGVPAIGDTPSVPCFYADHEESGYRTARHLLDLGHRRIALSYERCRGSELQSTYRWKGFAAALREAGLSPDEAAERTPPAETAAWRTDPDRAAAFFARPNAPTAIAAWNDWEARALLRVLRRAGLRIPQDVSLIGHDNDPASAEMEPPLDTIDQHLDMQVRYALRMLTSEQPLTAQNTVIVPTLVRGASCAAPADPSRLLDKGVVL